MADSEAKAGAAVEAGNTDTPSPPRKPKVEKGVADVNEKDPIHPAIKPKRNAFGNVLPPGSVKSFSLPPRKVAVKRLFVTVNPFGGSNRGLHILKKIRPIFEEAGVAVDVTETQYAGHNFDLAKTCDIDKYDAFCVLGGDGSIHEVINGMMNREDGRRIPIGLVPAGTGNSFAEDFGQPKPIDAARRIVAGMAQKVDVARVIFKEKTLYAFNILNWPADYMKRAESMRWAGAARYKIATGLDVLGGKFGRHVRLEIDGETIEDYIMMLHVQNNQHTGKALRAAPMARIDDGLFDLVLIRGMGRTEMAGMLGGIEDGTWIFHERAEYRRFQSLTLRVTDQPSVVNVDGEICCTEPVTIEVVAGALEIFGPNDC
eukprot:Opistho-2@72793